MLAAVLMRRILLGLVALAACANRAKPSSALYDAGDYAGAAREADRGLSDHPDDDDLWQMRIRSALALGDAEGVARAWAGYRERRGSDDTALLRDLATATLGQALASPSARMKLVAIEAVRSAELHALADRVAERMNDDDDRVVAAAAAAVLRGFPEAPKVASEMLRSEDPEARRIALEGVAKKIGKLAIAEVETAAADPDPRVRRAALRWVVQLKSSEAAALCERNLRHPDEGVRAAAATGLAQLRAGDLAGFATRALADQALAVRLAGVELLVAAKRTDELVQLAERADAIVALEAAIAARRRDLAQRALERAAGSDHPAIRAGAANLAVRAVGKPGAIAYAHTLTADPEATVRLAAARALVSAGDRAAGVAVFDAALATELSAATDLARLGEPRGLAALSAAIRDPEQTPEQRVVTATAHLTARRVTPGLVAALADPNGLVRAEAAAVLVALAR